MRLVLPDNPPAGDGHQDGFAKCGKVFNFAVAVGVISSAGLSLTCTEKKVSAAPTMSRSGVGRVR